MNELTQAQVRELFNYDPDTGLFTRLKTTGPRGQVGDTAGCDGGSGYILVMISGSKHRIHRLAFLYMTGSWPTAQVDHINGLRDDNRWSNLREVSNTENAQNQKRRCTNTSGTTGVSWNKSKNKWCAYLAVTGKRMYLGMFASLDEAIASRAAADIKYGYHPGHGKVL